MVVKRFLYPDTYVKGDGSTKMHTRRGAAGLTMPDAPAGPAAGCCDASQVLAAGSENELVGEVAAGPGVIASFGIVLRVRRRDARSAVLWSRPFRALPWGPASEGTPTGRSGRHLRGLPACWHGRAGVRAGRKIWGT